MGRMWTEGSLLSLRKLGGQLDYDVSDEQLLTAFAQLGDAAALSSLVERHSTLVWGVCRRLLRNTHDAEDAFQATFLVLVRKAATIRDKKALANWLHGVARQTAVRVRALSVKRHARETQLTDLPEQIGCEPDAPHELLAVLDQELRHLPYKYRIVILLCDLEGKTRKEAARELGCPEGTVAG